MPEDNATVKDNATAKDRPEDQSGEDRSNHPSQERAGQDEGQGPRHDPGEDSKALETPEGAREGERVTRDNGYRRNYGGFSREAAGTVGDRRSLDDWDPKTRKDSKRQDD